MLKERQDSAEINLLVYTLPNYTHKEGACSSAVSHDKAISVRFIMSFPFMYSVGSIPQVCLDYQREMEINCVPRR